MHVPHTKWHNFSMLTNATQAQRDAFAGDRSCSGLPLSMVDAGKQSHGCACCAVMC